MSWVLRTGREVSCEAFVHELICSRATWFFFFSLSAQAAGFIGMPIGAKMMDLWSPWAPLSITLLLGPLNGLLMVFMPETLALERKSTGEERLFFSEDEGWRMTIWSQFRHQIRNAEGSLAMLRNRSVALLLVCFVLIGPAASGMTGIFLQYFSKRFHRTLAEAGYVLALRGGLVMLVMGVLLPGLTKLLSSPRARMSAYQRDLFLARGSAIFLVVGLVLISGPNLGFVISGLVVFTLSSGISPLCRSLVTNFFEPKQTSRLFTLIGIIETVITLPCGPLLAWAFSTGMRLRGFWYGLPFLFLALFGVGAFVALFLLRAPESITVTIVRPDDEETHNGTVNIFVGESSSELSTEEPGI
jgi:PCFT/HCP family folate transporter-like MFS transporter 1/3